MASPERARRRDRDYCYKRDKQIKERTKQTTQGHKILT
jgi:hypothetical protein